MNVKGEIYNSYTAIFNMCNKESIFLKSQENGFLILYGRHENVILILEYLDDNK